MSSRGAPLERRARGNCPRCPPLNPALTTLPMVTWCVANFGQLAKLTFQYNFKCKTYLARYDHQHLICEESSYTMVWYEKNGSNRCVTFSKHKQKIPFLVVPCIKFVWYVRHVSLRRYQCCHPCSFPANLGLFSCGVAFLWKLAYFLFWDLF